MIVICEINGEKIDIDKDESYTVINNFSLKKEVICKKCHDICFGKQKEINALLREVDNKFKKNGGNP